MKKQMIVLTTEFNFAKAYAPKYMFSSVRPNHDELNADTLENTGLYHDYGIDRRKR